MNTASIAQDLIESSITTSSITHEDYTEDLAEELAELCDDSVDAGDVVEFWGSDWRVHLDVSESARILHGHSEY